MLVNFCKILLKWILRELGLIGFFGINLKVENGIDFIVDKLVM